MPLDEDEVAAVILGRPMPEMHETGVVECRRRLEARDMPAELAALLVGAQHHGQRVPAHGRADAPLDGVVAGVRRLLVRRDGVDVGRIGCERQPRPLPPRHVDGAAQQVVGALAAFEGHHRADGLDPLAGLRVRLVRAVVDLKNCPRHTTGSLSEAATRMCSI
jgi:hypothetical protein